MTGEDFGYLLQHIPGVMLWLGVNDTHPLHSPELSIDEAALVPGFEALKDFFNLADDSCSVSLSNQCLEFLEEKLCTKIFS